MVLGEPDRWLQQGADNLLGLFLWCPLEGRDLVHHLVPVQREAAWSDRGAEQFGQAVRVKRGLRCRGACQHPQPCVWLHDFVERLPTCSGCGLVCVRFINHHHVKVCISDLFLHNVDAIKVDDDKLSVRVDDLDALLLAAVRHTHLAVHRGFEDVGLPCRLHDRQRTDDQYALDLLEVHQVVSGPRDRHRLARAGVVKTKRSAMQRQECRGLLLVREGVVYTGPTVLGNDRGWHVLDLEVLQNLRFLQSPVDHHCAERAVFDECALGYDTQDLVRVPKS